MKVSARKEVILKAAGECFARYGYEKTTLDDIGKLVNLNKASLYYYYKNKESIFTEVILLESERYIQSLQARVAQLNACDEKIIYYLIERLKYYQQVINLHQLSIKTLQGVEPLFHELYQQVMEKEEAFIARLLDECIKTEYYQKTNTKLIAKSLLTVADAIKHKNMQQANVQFASEVNYSQIETEITFIINLILNGLKR
jgi:AcrR family transcriptional regulator